MQWTRETQKHCDTEDKDENADKRVTTEWIKTRKHRSEEMNM